MGFALHIHPFLHFTLLSATTDVTLGTGPEDDVAHECVQEVYIASSMDDVSSTALATSAAVPSVTGSNVSASDVLELAVALAQLA